LFDNRRPQVSLTGRLPIVQRAAISDDGNHVVCEFIDIDTGKSEVLLWNLAESSPQARSISASSVKTLSISSHGKYLLVADQQGRTQLWDLSGAEDQKHELSGHSGQVTAAAFSGDEKYVATCSGEIDRVIRIWSTAEPTEPIVLPQMEPLIHDLAFDNSGDRLFIADQSGVVSEWVLSAERLLQLAHRTAGRNLSNDEWAQYFGNAQVRPTFAPEGGGTIRSNEW
jgi:WD40 repeat protein